MKSVSSFSIRPFSQVDFPSYVSVVAAAEAVDGIGRPISESRLAEELNRPNYHPEENCFVARFDSTVVGYVRVMPELEIERVILEAVVHPEYRRRGIGKRLLEEGVSRGRGLGAKLAHVGIPQNSSALCHLVEKRGFSLVKRQHQLLLPNSIDVGEVQLGPPYRIRYFAPGDEETLTYIQNLCFSGSWGFNPNTVDEVRYNVAASYCQGEGVFFAEKDSEAVGYCWTQIEEMGSAGDRKGVVWMIGVSPEYRGKGIARALMVYSIDYLRSQGVKAVGLTVYSDNIGALKLYYSLGFTVKRDTLWYEKKLL